MTKIKHFLDALSSWYDQNKRDLPWIGEKDPYKVWVSEILLQQTTVRQGLKYYSNFIAAFPTVRALAQAREEKVMKVWQGLGYYSRARHMHQAARQILENHHGKIPPVYGELINLKGIGPYTAGAIMCFAFNTPCAAIDGNVIRVITRYYGIHDPVDTQAVFNKIRSIAQELVENAPPALFTQAIMDFGSLQCTPRSPLCHTCPLNKECLSYNQGTTHLIPVKSKKINKRKRYFHYLHIVNNDRFVLRKRVEKDIWKDLYDLPLVETPSSHELTPDQILNPFDFLPKSIRIGRIHAAKQTLTHQVIAAKFYHIELSDAPELPEGFSWHKRAGTLEKAVPKIIDLYLSDKSITLF